MRPEPCEVQGSPAPDVAHGRSADCGMKKPKWNSEFRNYFVRQKKVVIARTEGTCLRVEALRRASVAIS
jgi:hypothetical protein